MDFAVIEYHSKSGGVWRHTEARPNYLADPLKEIDPTSFGCYVSALAGEHIPLTWLILGQKNKCTRFIFKGIKRLRGRWPHWHSLAYLKKFDVLMVVHQLSDAHEIVHFLRRLRHTFPSTFVIGVPTQPFGSLQPHLDTYPAAKQTFIDYMNLCNIFLTVVKSTQSWYEALTTTPVVYMPQPYPVQYARDWFMPRTQKEPIILVAGVTQRPDIKKGQQAAVALQKKFPQYTIVVPKVADMDYDDTHLQGARWQFLPFEEWREHLTTLGRATLVMNTDYTQTRGRVQTDCAAVGTPSLGADSDGQVDLFPELATTPATPVADIIALGEKLLSDTTYYDHIVTYARERLKKYDYESSVARIQALVKTYRHV